MSKEFKEKDPISAVKVTLSTGKIVVLKEYKIKDNRLATKMLGNAKMNQLEAGIAMQENLLKILLLEIDGEPVDHAKKNDLDNIFSVKEYSQLMKVLSKMTGDDDGDNSLGEDAIETLLI